MHRRACAVDNLENAAAENPKQDKFVGGYRKIRDLGMGSFGKAILVEHKSSGQKCVMKAVDITRLHPKQREQSINEVKLLGSVKHPFIIAYRESFIVNGFLCIITDYAEGGDLHRAIKKKREEGGCFTERQILQWMIQCLLALKHLHKKHILHRDVKSQNIFLSASGRIRLGDFGIAKALDCTTSFARTMIGTPYYLSPEICKSQPYSWASDIWSVGCVLYELCALRVPFEANNMKALVTRIAEGRPPILPLQYSNDLRNLYLRLLAKNPEDRPTATEFLCDPLIRMECELMLHEESGRRVTSPIFLPSPFSREEETVVLKKQIDARKGRRHKCQSIARNVERDMDVVSRVLYPTIHTPPSGNRTHHVKYLSLLKPSRWAGALRKMKVQSL